MKVIAAVLVAGALLLVAAGPAKRAYDNTHIGAPALVYHCPPGSFVKRWWVKASNPEGAGAPGTLEYHGWREIAACASSTMVSSG
jgi:hypothetical protein